MESAKTCFISIKVEPAETHKDKESVGGAFASCWVVESLPETALQRAKQYLIERMWKIHSIEKEPTEIFAEQYVNDDFGFSFFEQAQRKGLSVSMAIWPKEESHPN